MDGARARRLHLLQELFGGNALDKELYRQEPTGTVLLCQRSGKFYRLYRQHSSIMSSYCSTTYDEAIGLGETKFYPVLQYCCIPVL